LIAECDYANCWLDLTDEPYEQIINEQQQQADAKSKRQNADNPTL